LAELQKSAPAYFVYTRARTLGAIMQPVDPLMRTPSTVLFLAALLTLRGSHWRIRVGGSVRDLRREVFSRRSDY